MEDPTTNSNGPEDRLLRCDDVAEVLKISTRQVWRLTTSGTLPMPIRLGGATRWRHSDIQNLIGKVEEALP